MQIEETNNIDRGKVSALVISCLQDALCLSKKGSLTQLKESIPLIGTDSPLDSLDLVTLIIELEEKLKEEYNISSTLANEYAMSQKNSPFQTIESLTDYICILIHKEKKNNGS